MGVSLYCNNCDKGAKALHQRMSSMFLEQETIKKDLSELKATQKSFKDEFEDFKVTTETKIRELDQQDTITTLETKIKDIEMKFRDEADNKTLWDEITKLND